MLSVRTPGGGGHGDRFQRPRAAVLADVGAGLVSREHARDAYGVVLAGERVDETATVALRAERSGQASPGEMPPGDMTHAQFDFGARAPRARASLAVRAARCVHRAADEPARAVSRVRAPDAVRPGGRARRTTAGDPEDILRLWQELRGSIGLR